MPNKLGKKNGQFGELLSFALAVPNNQIAQSNLPQPEIRKAYACAPDASVWHIPMLCQPKLSRGASQCATEALATGVAMLRDFRVGDRDFANLPHQEGDSMPYAKGCGAPPADIGPWRTGRAHLVVSGGCPCAAIWRNGTGGAQNKKGDLTGWSNLLSAVRTRLEPAQARAFRAIHVTPRRQRRLPPRGAGAARSRLPQNKKRSSGPRT